MKRRAADPRDGSYVDVQDAVDAAARYAVALKKSFYVYLADGYRITPNQPSRFRTHWVVHHDGRLGSWRPPSGPASEVGVISYHMIIK